LNHGRSARRVVMPSAVDRVCSPADRSTQRMPARLAVKST
jgi:hypothetical protein